ncbi:sugar ABC transporter permease [Paenibacillus sp. LHD-117]|uniref:carbohydrate ABC transporter permease n=1 Tax=Paenibacillus sp. LHD-117 TaxID=3071412 RepID=UPI0027E001E7|nr:sugar ABC transporter permease [Paenibacillus sp. LHD-117]MDQ6418904.1 sugar ABC transporter permease [Paenibacillus sp. LHD-117]
MRISKSTISLFLLPAVALYLCIFLYPTVRALLMSFFEIPNIASRMSEWKFIGFENYWQLLHNTYFIGSSWNVFKIWLFGGIVVLFFAFLFAAILASGVRGKSFWRSLVYLPNIVSPVVLTVVWLHYIFNSTYGFLTKTFRFLGLNGLADLQWTSDDHLFLSMLIAYCFGSIGYFMLLLNAGMERIPHDYYEAALLEGAGPLTKFFSITLPLLQDVFRMALVLWTITAINFFVWSATFGQESPETMTPGYYMYIKVFGSSTTVYQEDSFNVGAGATVGVIITVSILVLSAVINLFFRRKERLEY